MSKPKLAIVIGSIRPNRFGGHAAQWIEEIARRRTDFEVELIDLKDYPMPLFAEEASPLPGAGRRKSANSTPLSSRLPNTIADRPRF